MITIPFEVIVFMGLLACAREAYNVFWIKNVKNVGSLFVNAVMTIIYIFLVYEQYNNDVPSFHGSPFVRAGIFLMFLDKAVVFFYEIREYNKTKRIADKLWKRLSPP